VVGALDGSAVGRLEGDEDGCTVVGVAVVGLDVTGASVGLLEGDKDGSSVTGAEGEAILVAVKVN